MFQLLFFISGCTKRTIFGTIKSSLLTNLIIFIFLILSKRLSVIFFKTMWQFVLAYFDVLLFNLNVSWRMADKFSPSTIVIHTYQWTR